MRLSACDVLTRLTFEKASIRMGERGRAAHGVCQRFRPARSRHDDLLVRSPQAYAEINTMRFWLILTPQMVYFEKQISTREVPLGKSRYCRWRPN